MSGLNLKGCTNLEKYFREIYFWTPNGSHCSSIQLKGKLGYYMSKLYKLSKYCLNNNYAIKYLDKIRLIRCPNQSLNDWKKQYTEYLLILTKRQEYIIRHNYTKNIFQKKLTQIEPLDNENWNIWGSCRQLKFGKIIVDTMELEIDPIFGALLNPTGGIVGPGNKSLLSGRCYDPIVMHGIVHDAGGYLYNYHKFGPGYNYLKTKLTIFPTKSPLSSQIYGFYYWKSILKKFNKEINHNKTNYNEL
jgi:hypothetical protein